MNENSASASRTDTQAPAKGRPLRPRIPSGLNRVENDLVWHKELARRLSYALLGVSAVWVVTLILLIWKAFIPVRPVYFAATPDMRIVRLVPLDQPFISNSGLLDWAVQTVTATLGFDFENYRRELERVRSDYTPQAFDQVVQALINSGIMDKVRKDRLAINTVPTASPIIAASGIIDGRYAWKISFPIIITYQGSTGVVGSQKAIVNMIVMRQNTIEYPKGVAITQLIIQNSGD